MGEFPIMEVHLMTEMMSGVEHAEDPTPATGPDERLIDRLIGQASSLPGFPVPSAIFSGWRSSRFLMRTDGVTPSTSWTNAYREASEEIRWSTADRRGK